jgi:hypothetical protein
MSSIKLVRGEKVRNRFRFHSGRNLPYRGTQRDDGDEQSSYK